MEKGKTNFGWYVVAVVAAAVLVILVFTDWDIELKRGKEAIADENSLTILYFENLADPSDSLRLGEIASSLLIIDLSESQYIDVKYVVVGAHHNDCSH